MPIDPKAGAEHLRRVFPDGARVEWVYNPGNFGNASFRVRDGARDLHVKLVEDPTELDVWFRHRERLARDYRAPEILARLPIPEAGAFAFVFPRLPGRMPDPARAAKLLPEILALLGRLHADTGLAATLDGEATYLSCYENGILECLTEDLRSVRAHRSVSRYHDAATAAWLVEEASALAEAGREHLPDEPVLSATHGDLWFQNVLDAGDDWHLLDWDSLGIGDPATDYMWLALDARTRGTDPDEFLPPDPALRARVRFLVRAASFDAIVDPLSDLTEMPPGVPGAEKIRAEKRAASDAALRRYRRVRP